MIASLCILTLLNGCSPEERTELPKDTGTIRLQLIAAGMAESTPTESENSINEAEVYRFENGILQEHFGSLTPDTDGTCSLTPTRMTGTLRFVANAPASLQEAALTEGQTTLEEFMRLTATAEEMSTTSITMTGQLELDKNSIATVSLKRSVARIDLYSPASKVNVYQVRISGVATSGYVNEQSGSPADATTGTIEKDYTNSPLTSTRQTLCYVCEQEGNNPEAELTVTTSDGAWHRLRATLPTPIRNTVYTLKVYGKGTDLRAEVIEGEWENGMTTETEPVLKGLVDKESSQLPEGTTVNTRGDTVRVPYYESTLRLVLKAEEGARLAINGQAEGVNVSLRNVTRSLIQIAEVDVNSLRKMPGSERQYIHLDTYLQNIRTGRVVLVFEPNPIRLTGSLKFNQDAVCDYGRYIDGELGVLTLPTDKALSVETDTDEAPWLILADNGTKSTYRILAGWKPNDPHADGRIQEARLVVTDCDGSNRETYTIRRQNWGLPVTNINGTWWCKYNLRGNVKDFADQILPKNDPATGETALLDYLLACTDEKLLELLGNQYQAGNPEGLKLTYDGENFYYEGFQSSADNFGTLPPTTMAPDGYQIPSYDDFRFFAWNENSNLGYFNPGTFENKLGQRLNFRVTERNLTISGADYGTVALYDFEYEGNHWILCGLGHQWDDKSISKMMILLAMHGDANRTWLMEGYPQSDGRGNWLKYANQNAVKTRTIRCIKTPVEYEY